MKATRLFSTAVGATKLPPAPNYQHIKRFYKNVTVIEHPNSNDLPKLEKDESVSLNNLSLSHDKYWAIALDGRVTKTFYKDILAVPSRAFAVALAEEWESQGEKIDLKCMPLNQLLSKGIRVANDHALVTFMQEQV